MLWSNIYQCHIPHIDAQHKALFELIDKLGTMHGDLSRIPQTVSFLQEYVTEHFSDEESLHAQTRYSLALKHSRLHQAFSHKVSEVRSKYEASGHSLLTLMDMNHALVEWLKDHILKEDKQFADYFHTLPDRMKNSLRLPLRPWIPESSQSFYREVTGVRPAEEPAASPKTPAQGTGVLGSSWTDSMLCGIDAIDEQHKELFRQIDILRDRSKSDNVASVLRFLADYVQKHFRDEQVIHQSSRYPRADEHRRLHEKFVQEFMELKKKFDASGGGSLMVLEINRVVFEWLRNHVMKVDKEFAAYYHSRNA